MASVSAHAINNKSPPLPSLNGEPLHIKTNGGGSENNPHFLASQLTIGSVFLSGKK